MGAVKKVIVVGGGIGGLTVAHALARQGIETRVIEIGDRSERLGTGITLLGNALRALNTLGLVDDCLAGGKGWDKITMRDATGGLIAEQNSPRVWDPERPGALGIMRPVLGQVLEDHARESGATVDFNTHITAIEQDAEGVTVTLSNGETDRADLLIAADGVYSKTRSMVFGEQHKPQYVGQGVWRYTIPRHEAFEGFALYRIPTGPGVGSLLLSDELCYLFFLENSKERPRFSDADGPDHIRRLLAPYTAEELVEAREEVSADRHISYRPFDVLMMENAWHLGRVVLLGDAAHSLTPQMTSGGGMAIEDALVLSEELAVTDDLDTALRAYFERRFPRVRKVFDVGYAICVEEQDPKHGREYAMGLLQEGHRFLAGPA
ncbi:FAD-dependent oxidoreductase (plasmid) [Shimia sp. W99]